MYVSYDLSALEKMPATEALPHYLDLLEANPADNRILGNSIRVMARLRRRDLLDIVIPEAEQRVQDYPQDYALVGALMRGYCAAGLYMQAVALTDSKVDDKGATGLSFLNDCIRIYADVGKVSKANRIANMLISHHPHNPRAVRTAMFVYNNFKFQRNAIEAAHMLVNMHEYYPIPEVLSDAMLIYANYNEEARAGYCLSQLLPEHIQHSKVVLSALETFLVLKKPEYLRDHLPAIEAAHAQNCDVMVNVANYYWRLGDGDKAATIMDSDLFKRHHPTSDHLLQGIDVLTKLERKDKAIEWTDKLLAMRRRDHISMKFAATTYLCHNEADKALQAINYMEEVGKDDERAQKYRYLAGLLMGDERVTAKALASVWGRDFNGRWSETLKGVGAWYDGDTAKATEAFARCLGEEHRNITVLYLMAAPQDHPDRKALQQQMPANAFAKLSEYAHKVRNGDYPLVRVALGYLPDSQDIYRRERVALKF
jgi:tetratricopeptide (TPR) repeat protein